MKRIVLPLMLILAGLGLIAYGAARGSPVLVEERITAPTPPRPVPQFGRPPTPPAPPKPVTVVRAIEEPESKLILEVTRGGLLRLPDGRLKRTYTGAPPSGCPT